MRRTLLNKTTSWSPIDGERSSFQFRVIAVPKDLILRSFDFNHLNNTFAVHTHTNTEAPMKFVVHPSQTGGEIRRWQISYRPDVLWQAALTASARAAFTLVLLLAFGSSTCCSEVVSLQSSFPIMCFGSMCTTKIGRHKPLNPGPLALDRA